MFVKKEHDVFPEIIRNNATIRWVISKKDGAANFFMRIVELLEDAEQRGLHHHPYEHEIYVIDGSGFLLGIDETFEISKGDIIFIKPNESHAIAQKEYLKFICLIPGTTVDGTETVPD